MEHVTIRFYAELNDLLRPPWRQVRFSQVLIGPTGVKDLIESLGVPHTEVDLILVDGEAVDFSYRVQAGDRISVYPVFRSIPLPDSWRLSPALPSPARFVADTHLGKLAAYLRLLGFDGWYRNHADDVTLAEVASEEGRVLLTQDRGLLKRGNVTRGYLVRSADPRAQLIELLRRYDLCDAVQPFTRCVRCNGLLEPVPKEAVLERLPPRTRAEHQEFFVCSGCDRVFWKGSHYDRMRAFIDSVLAESTGRVVAEGGRNTASTWLTTGLDSAADFRDRQPDGREPD